MSSGNRKLGPRLVVMILALGIVVLGAYPIRRHYGGAKGLYERAFPGGFQWGLPDVKAVRAYLMSLDEETRKRKSTEGATRVKTVKLSPEVGGSTSSSTSGGFFAGLRNFFGGADGSDGQGAAPAGERPVVAGSGERDKTPARAQLGPVDKPPPKQLDKLSQKDREELNKLIDGF